jgi:pimeloyl-ACP methyl ester carboxylesterase
MPFATAPDGVRLHYSVEGDGPALLLHLGAGCDSELWCAAGYVTPLADSFRCILFDHRGHGMSDRPRGADAHRVERYVADVVALLDALGVEACAFWGYSRGIDPGLMLAIEHPQRVWAVVGSGTVAGPMSPERAAELGAEFSEHGWERLLERFDEQERDPVPPWIKQRIRRTDVGQFVDFLAAVAQEGWDARAALPRVGASTLFLTGELEDPADQAARDAAAMPRARRIRLEGLGHINAFLRGDLVLPHVTAFLGEQSVRYSDASQPKSSSR